MSDSPEKEKLPNEKQSNDKPHELDKYDLEANENLLKSRAYILFTMDNTKDSDTKFNYDPSKLNEMEIIGFLTTAINTLERLKARVEYYNTFGVGDEEDNVCDECGASLDDDDDD